MIEELLNKIIFKYTKSDEERIDFYWYWCTHLYSMYHEQDCCESVSIDDINIYQMQQHMMIKKIVTIITKKIPIR
jgi:hypothetical protein